MKTSHVSIGYYGDNKHNAIRWCSRTHNFYRGCSPISEACKYCYAAAEGIHQQVLRPNGPYRRLAIIKNGRPCWTGLVERTGAKYWTAPFRTQQRWLAFTNSMSDVFHESLSDQDILDFLRVLHRARWHVWQVLTKRADRMAALMSRLFEQDGLLQLAHRPLALAARYEIPNVWLGVTAENQRMANERIPRLLDVKATVRFVSAEPLLGEIDLRPYLSGLHWVIVGGESAGPEKVFRPMDVGWATSLRDQCAGFDTAFFFKQFAGLNPNHLAKELDGRRWEELPRRGLLTIPSNNERAELIAWATTRVGDVQFGGATSERGLRVSR